MADPTYRATPHGRNCGRIGREVEVKAWLWLTQHGYEVFDNIFPNGPIDLVAVDPKTGDVLKIEVRSHHRYTKRDGSNSLSHPAISEQQARLGVQMLTYFPSSDEFELVDPGAARIKRDRSVAAAAEALARGEAKRDADKAKYRARYLGRKAALAGP